MKTLTLVCNFVLFGFTSLMILTKGLPDENNQVILTILILMGIILNVVLISGSNLNPKWLKFIYNSTVKENKTPSTFLVAKILAVVMNALMLGIVFWDLRKGSIGGSGILFYILISLIIFTPLLSILRIIPGRWNRFTGFKKTVLKTGISLSVFIIIFTITILISIRQGIEKNISIAKKEYPGKAEDALLAYLADQAKTPYERTHVAIWTLGQIRSNKALPVLKELYLNDPDGKLCYNKHNTKLCQRKINTAINLIESKNRLFSWERLNR